ncbi:MAG: 3-dehydroquinate synthase [Flavobacteriaceae bacterium]
MSAAANAEVRKVRVELADRGYDILIGPGLMERAAEHIAALAPGARLAIITDANVAAAQLGRLEDSLRHGGLDANSLIVPPGEKSKSFARLQEVTDFLLDHRIERGDLVVALGGGVVGDLAGFAASILRRGVRFVQIPTSLLAQVDSSIGGKTGIDTAHGKNLIGAFHQPALVLADIESLDTLPVREFRAGYAEVVKYGLLGDRGFFDWLEKEWPSVFSGGHARIRAIATSCAAKAGIVARDERESGERALLNLGHTFGHAFEAACGYSDRLLHGEAIAIGMICAFEMSERLGHVAAQETARVRAHFHAVGLPTDTFQVEGGLPDADTLMDLIAQDKKVERGSLTFILVRAIGEAFVARGLDAAAIRSYLAEKLAQAPDP